MFYCEDMGTKVQAKDDKTFDNLSIVQKRLEILLSTKLRDKTNIKQAIEKQDRLSKKSARKWSGTEQIRKWRDRRCSSSTPR